MDYGLPRVPDHQSPFLVPSHPKGVHARFRGSANKAIPSCCRPVGYCRDCDPCGEPSTHVGVPLRIHGRIARKSMETV